MEYGSRWTLAVEQHHVITERGPHKGKESVNPDLYVRLIEYTQKKFLKTLKAGRLGSDENWHEVLMTKPILVQKEGLVAISAIAAEQVDNDISTLIHAAFALGREFERQQAQREKS